MSTYRERGGAVLITTVLVLLIAGVLAMALLNSSRIGSRVTGNYKLQENAFNIAETGFERVRSQFTNFNNTVSRLFYNPADATRLYDPNFNLYGEITSNSGVYGTYYAQYPQFKGTETIQLPSGNTLQGEWYIRIIDNDLVCNQPLSGDMIQNGYLNTDKIKAALAETDLDRRKQLMNGVMLNCRELNNGGTGNCDAMPTIDFSQNWDNSVFVESRGIIRQGGQVVASRLVRYLVRTSLTGGGGRNPTQKGGAAGGTRSNVAGGVIPVGWGK